MKQQWQRFELKIDALSLRERAMAFAIAALILIALINSLVLDPLLAKQEKLSQQVTQNQQQIAALQAEIQARVKSHDIDPDAPNRQRLAHLKAQMTRLSSDMEGLQKGLVPPDKMPALLQDLLKKNEGLKLLSLKTLPVASLQDVAQAESSSGSKTTDTGVLYKHGVEVVVRGNYADLTRYLAQLESMPWQLFWAGASLNVDAHPDMTLKLTLFTLSLDRKWLNI
jgi:MSHA biogenesis protein MshJ